ncbi:PQQ-like beta-propeller repeat protein [Rubripirellula amarantea]|uniref:Outer membrane biogenesis protein BamB n=1 Tax=Rubripirellula amarantea TaxID=2527999 RepID=A0A5C5WQB8_9BACT|nr:PQQ-binding-like beta-propeller repeat protein [Rubripirellula amarantea]MDA8744700.1 PQQ-like beta-propeller repeat protein [Rubripirellula amarantea]TWT52737.1 outer membrane biogenesis protein BamB [Rubripirellula amarantea]
MTTRLNLTLSVICCLCLSTALNAQERWPQWRGASQQGATQGNGFPLQWSENEGIQWKTEIAGQGSSTPVTDSGVAYLTAGSDGKNTLIAVGLDDGKVLWQTQIGEDRGQKHKKGGGSNPSAVVDDGLVYAYFRSGDLACVNADGKVVWQTNLQEEFGEDTLWWDLGSSPLLTPDAVVVAVMQTGPSYLVAYDKKSGDMLWKEDRNVDAPKEAAQSYSTPLLTKVNGQSVIAVMGADHLTLHDASTGKTLGSLGGFNPTNHEFFRSISSPVAAGNLIVCPYARGETITCVDMSKLIAGAGEDAIVWSRDDVGSDVPTPAIVGKSVYVVSDGKQSRGTVYNLNLNSGETTWEVSVPKSRIGFSSSPLVAGDHLYVTGEDGKTHVIGPLSADHPSVVSSNPLSDDEPFTTASPVPYDGDLLIRTKNFLHRL